MRRGLLLVNLGTPDAPTTSAVRRYLREFLSDPNVIDLHPVARWLLVNAVIAPFRSPRSAEAYRKIWTQRGSPLLFHSQDLAARVAERLGDEFVVELGMRYASPSLADAMTRLRERGVEEVVLFPLYPQYATSSTGSTVQRARQLAGAEMTAVEVVPPFYAAEEFLDAFADVAKPAIAALEADHVLFSFHGLPERHVTRLDKTGAHCLRSPSCCDAIVDANSQCYRAQCFHTARELARRLGVTAYTVGFQSRLSSRWIRPFTDELLPELARRGVKRLAVMCPAFVADCLETLEEIGIRARAAFLAAGGSELGLVPSLNASPRWVEAVVTLARRAGRSVRSPR